MRRSGAPPLPPSGAPAAAAAASSGGAGVSGSQQLRSSMRRSIGGGGPPPAASAAASASDSSVRRSTATRHSLGGLSSTRTSVGSAADAPVRASSAERGLRSSSAGALTAGDAPVAGLEAAVAELRQKVAQLEEEKRGLLQHVQDLLRLREGDALWEPRSDRYSKMTSLGWAPPTRIPGPRHAPQPRVLVDESFVTAPELGDTPMKVEAADGDEQEEEEEHKFEYFDAQTTPAHRESSERETPLRSGGRLITQSGTFPTMNFEMSMIGDSTLIPVDASTRFSDDST